MLPATRSATECSNSSQSCRSEEQCTYGRFDFVGEVNSSPRRSPAVLLSPQSRTAGARFHFGFGASSGRAMPNGAHSPSRTEDARLLRRGFGFCRRVIALKASEDLSLGIN